HASGRARLADRAVDPVSTVCLHCALPGGAAPAPALISAFVAAKRRSPDTAARLIDSYKSVRVGPSAECDLPSQEEVARAFEDVRDLLYPGLTGRPVRTTRTAVTKKLLATERRLARQVWLGLCHRAQSGGGCSDGKVPPLSMARDMARRLLARLPELRAALAEDVEAAYGGDPAATGTDEIVFCYPGVYAITAYRVAHALLDIGVPVLPRMMTEHAHEKTGIDIHPGATIGES